MKRKLVLLAVLSALALLPARGFAVNLLGNGDLNLATDADPFDVFAPEPDSWTLETNPGGYGDPIPFEAGYYQAFQEGYAEHANPGGAGTLGMVYNSTNGNFPGFPDVPTVDADLKQSVPGTPGYKYTMTGWAYFEGGYPGGVDFLAADSPNPRAVAALPGLAPSLTDTFFALEFLDGGGMVLPGSVEIELKAAGQVNNPDITEATRNWMQHMLMGVAPAGTVSVQVRASMVDGEFNVDLPHQAAWFDDFELTCVPEPASCLLGLLGLALVGVVRRKR